VRVGNGDPIVDPQRLIRPNASASSHGRAERRLLAEGMLRDPEALTAYEGGGIAGTDWWAATYAVNPGLSDAFFVRTVARAPRTCWAGRGSWRRGAKRDGGRGAVRKAVPLILARLMGRGRGPRGSRGPLPEGQTTVRVLGRNFFLGPHRKK